MNSDQTTNLTMEDMQIIYHYLKQQYEVLFLEPTMQCNAMIMFNYCI